MGGGGKSEEIMALKGAVRCALFCIALAVVGAEDPYRFFTWNVTYGVKFLLGVPQQVRPSVFRPPDQPGGNPAADLDLDFSVNCGERVVVLAGNSHQRGVSRSGNLLGDQQQSHHQCLQ